MAYVNPSTQSLKTCFQSHYSLPYFQREYKWESRHFAELLDDIQAAFLLNYDQSHGRTAVADYSPYFLGSIITSSDQGGKKPLIDGQQRLTSTFLLLAYLERYRRDHSIQNAINLTTYLGNVSFGSMNYAIEFSDSRKALFDCYLNESKTVNQALDDAEEIPGLDDGDRRLLEALRITDVSLNTNVKLALAYFIDYVVERVILIDISVNTESEAHRVFVTMNDRGLRLGPIELLKGQILSKIPDRTDSQSCHTLWVETVNKLRSLGSEEDSLFFRNLFRAKWAVTMRGKTKGDPAGDFDNIGEAYHRWFDENTSKLAINNSDDYVKFARDDIPKYAEAYVFIKKAEAEPTQNFESIYYNSIRKFSSQSMILLSVVEASDTTTEWQKKISLVAKYLDLILTSRTIDGKQNNYDNLKDIAFSITKELRKKTSTQLLDYLRSEWNKYYATIPKLATLTYTKADKSDLLYILARIASYLEDIFDLTNRVGFKVYLRRDRGGKTFDIEHLLKKAFDSNSLPTNHGFTDAKDYDDQRNLIGALSLLPRSRNRSLQDRPYREKLEAYSTENILTQTLCEGLYESNPNIATYVQSTPEIGLSAVTDFGKKHIADRTAMYVAVASKVWATP